MINANSTEMKTLNALFIKHNCEKNSSELNVYFVRKIGENVHSIIRTNGHFVVVFQVFGDFGMQMNEEKGFTYDPKNRVFTETKTESMNFTRLYKFIPNISECTLVDYYTAFAPEYVVLMNQIFLLLESKHSVSAYQPYSMNNLSGKVWTIKDTTCMIMPLHRLTR